MKDKKLKGDTPLGQTLQKRPDKKREAKELIEYLKINADEFSQEQMRNALQDLSEKHEQP